MSLQLRLLRKDVFSVRVRIAPLVLKFRFEELLKSHGFGFRNPAAAVYEIEVSAEEVRACLEDEDVGFVGFG